MAKKPEGRPASAHDLAQAALALVRGDTDEGLALIPYVPEATSSSGGSATGSTEDSAKAGPKKPLTLGRNFWIFSAVGAFVALALIATSLTILLQPPSEELTDDLIVPTLPEVGEEEPQTILPEETPEEDTDVPIETVRISENEIVGKTKAQVEELLVQKGLRLDPITGNIAPATDLVQTAYRVNPQGTVAKNTLVAVYFYAAIPEPPKQARQSCWNGRATRSVPPALRSRATRCRLWAARLLTEMAQRFSNPNKPLQMCWWERAHPSPQATS
jgi:hypothetical protein